ncbi:MAG: hypothetical protein K9W42_11295 [Candidatus Heimdallarchaeota archaeon]|nr:hypothetical protein [Candidatus Heimdallarchaeota archaeon]
MSTTITKSRMIATLVLIVSLLTILTNSMNLKYVENATEKQAMQKSSLQLEPITLKSDPKDNNWTFIGKISQLDDDYGEIRRIIIAGDFAYVIHTYYGIEIINIQNTLNLEKVFIYTPAEIPASFDFKDGFLYLTDTSRDLCVINATDNSDLQTMGIYDDNTGNGYDVAVQGECAFVANGLDGLEIFNVSIKNNIKKIATYKITGELAIRVTVAGDLAFVSFSDYGLVVLNISDITHPKKIITLANSQSVGSATVSNEFLYLTLMEGGFSIYNITNTTNIEKMSSVFLSSDTLAISIMNGNYSCVANGGNGVSFFNVTNKNEPQKMGTFYDGGNANDVAFDGKFIYVADFEDGLEILGKDSDGDGLADYLETEVYGTNPNLYDTDSDGLSDGDELSLGTNPFDLDTDNDLLDDFWEVTFGTNPLEADANEDLDGDGLPSLLEYHLQTEPLNADTDGDNFTDGDEFRYGTDPLNPNDFPQKEEESNPSNWWVWVIFGGVAFVLMFLLTFIVIFAKNKRQQRRVMPDEPVLEQESGDEETFEPAIFREEESDESLPENEIRKTFPVLQKTSEIPNPSGFLSDLLLVRTILIINKNGIPLFSVNFDEELDSTLTAGFITAITNFNEEMIMQKKGPRSNFTQMGQEGGIFWIFDGAFVKLALLLKSEPSKQFKKPIRTFLRQFENTFENKLKNFSGNVADFLPTHKLLEKYLHTYYLSPMKIDPNFMRRKIIAKLHIRKTLEYYQENFNEEHTVYLQQLIEHSFKNLKTLSYDAIISEIITLVNERILLPVKSEEDIEVEEYRNIDD